MIKNILVLIGSVLLLAILSPSSVYAQVDPNKSGQNNFMLLLGDESVYRIGDRVELTVDNPAYCSTCNGALDLTAGRIGTVICNPSMFGVLVSWDNWTQGHNRISFCKNTPNPFPDNSGWWVLDSQIIQAPSSAHEVPALERTSLIALILAMLTMVFSFSKYFQRQVIN